MKLIETAKALSATEEIGTITYLESQFDGVDDSGFGNISMHVKQKMVQLKRKTISAGVPATLSKELSQLHGIDASQMTKSTLLNEYEHQVEKEILKMYIDHGTENFKSASYPGWKRTQKILHRLFGYKPKFYYADSTQLMSKIFLFSNLIATKTRTGPGNFVIVSPQVRSYLEDSPVFTFVDSRALETQTTVSHAGNLRGSINVFVDFASPAERVVIGSATQDSNPGIYHAKRMNSDANAPFSFEEITEQHTMATKISLITTEAFVEVGDLTGKYFTIQMTDKKYNFLSYLWEKLKGKKNVKQPVQPLTRDL